MKRSTSFFTAALFLIAVGITSSSTALFAQDGEAEVRFGFHAAAQLNLVGAGAINDARLSPEFAFIEEDLSDGQGLAPYFGAVAEYTSGDILGIALRVSVDQKTAEMESPNTGQIFTSRMSYVSIEPGMRFNLGSPSFSITAGPVLGVNLAGKYDYDFNGEDNVPNIDGQQMSGVNNVAFGFFGDFGYDIRLRGGDGHTSIYLTPFLGASWLLDQRKSTTTVQDERDDIWSTISIRLGTQLKFGAQVGDNR